MEGQTNGVACQVCGNHFQVNEVIKAKLVEEPIGGEWGNHWFTYKDLKGSGYRGRPFLSVSVI